MLILVMGAVSAGLFSDDSNTPADPSDKVFVKIGDDDFLNATLEGCKVISEENIPDATYNSTDGEIGWYDAKNISYIDTDGNKGYLIVWKASPDKYLFNDSKDVNQYTSNYLLDIPAISFLEYSYENNAVYGIILGTDPIYYGESDLLYGVLNLNPDGFQLVYSDSGTSQSSSPSTSSSSSSSSSGDHYHTVVGSRSSVAKNDPDSYYDYYEYGDNYEIDDYLESEGYE